MIHIETLNSDLLPRPSRSKFSGSKDKRRLIFVGDIHGCKDELKALLKKVRFNEATDHLVTAGDMVNKGPDTAGVIDILRQKKASCVRGNHEDRILLMADHMSSSTLHASNPSAGASYRDNNILMSPESPEMTLAKSLSKNQLAYLPSCPVILKVGKMKSLGDIVVVHAGLVPGLRLESQDPASVMNMRIIDLSTHVPSKAHEREGSLPWAKLWNKYQRLLPTQNNVFSLRHLREWKQSDPTTVVYAHDSKRGLQIDKYTKGLDTGCVKGGHLTALVLGDGGSQDIVQVKCKKYRE